MSSIDTPAHFGLLHGTGGEHSSVELNLYPGLFARLIGISGLYALEVVFQLLLKGAGPGRHLLIVNPLVNGGWTVGAFRFAIFFLFSYAAVTAVKSRKELNRLSQELTRIPICWQLLLLQLLTALVFGIFPFLKHGLNLSGGLEVPYQVLRLLLLPVSLLLGALAIGPLGIWLAILRAGGKSAWLLATVVSATVNPLSSLLWSLSTPLADLTFRTVLCFLRPFWEIEADPGHRVIGTATFSVEVDPSCSGMEGMVLMLLFGCLWLYLFRKDYRFPHALTLVPLGLGLQWIVNSARIALLIVIGTLGKPEIAIGGFHSQAGWMGFIAVSFGILIASLYSPWLSANHVAVASRAPAKHETAATNPTAIYLAPFLVALIAAMISRASSGEFEWMYPLRFFAVMGVLWFSRSCYRRMPRSFDWRAPVAGVFVFAIWLTLDRFLAGSPNDRLATSLAGLSPLAKTCWITFRVLNSIFTLPVVEELAFRGFLARRVLSSNFETVSYRRLTWFSIGFSSLVFGLMHGDRWIAGILAGLVYAFLVKRTGRLGDAVLAHSTTNLLIAGAVLLFERWDLWSR